MTRHDPIAFPRVFRLPARVPWGVFRSSRRGTPSHVFAVATLFLLATFPALGGDKSGVGPDKISLPSGPGSIEGLGESFQPQLNTGTSAFGITIALPSGVNGLQPTVRLGYNSGGGNSCFGIGWELACETIQRQTDNGAPNYSESDVFVCGGEDLVPLQDGTWRREIEDSFDCHRQVGDGWEYKSRNGTLYKLGTYPNAEQPDRVSRVYDGFSGFSSTFKWCVDTVIDASGNRMEYFYQTFADSPGQLYLSEIRYSIFGGHCHSVRFDYELRDDAFSDYRAGFEIRTARLCFQIRVTSDGRPVRTYRIAYAIEPDDPLADPPDPADFTPPFSLIRKVTQYGRDGVSYLPPLRLKYTRFDITGIRQGEIENAPPISLDTGLLDIVDINCDGLPDFLYTPAMPGLPHQYFLNLGNGRFANGADFAQSPASVVLSESAVQLADFDGNGQCDLVVKSGSSADGLFCFYPNPARLDQPETNQIRWGAPVSFPSPHPPFALDDPSVKMMDLDFDKRMDFVRSSLYGMQYFFNRGENGWEESDFYLRGEPILADQAIADDLAFARPGPRGEMVSNSSVQLADMNGDRMPDLVRILRFISVIEIEYWPYKGSGAWGDRRLATGELAVGPVDDSSIHLLDVNEDGLSDVAVVHYDQVHLYLNTGNDSFTRAIVAANTPRYIHGVTQLRTADINGNGSTDVIWQNWDAGRGEYKMEYVDFLPAGKANILAVMDNGIGLQTHVSYKSSTEDYIAAAEEGYPWQTRNPDPLMVVARITRKIGLDLNHDGKPDEYHTDLFYRDAYYDGFEKEFRGFSFAQRVQRGDDYDPATGYTDPLGFLRVSGPSSVTRFRYHTGSADGVDNDAYPPGYAGPTPMDEFFPSAGTEEEALKGLSLMEENVDAAALADPAASFHCGAYQCATGAAPGMTPDTYVYTRSRTRYSLRRLYRPASVVSPPGRFADNPVLAPTLKSVTFVQTDATEIETIEANQRLVNTHGYAVRPPKRTLTEMEYDNYGNTTLQAEWGFVEDTDRNGAFDSTADKAVGSDERITRTAYALGGEALLRWILSNPARVTVEDLQGNFVSETRNYYDGKGPLRLVGRPLGEIGERGLVSRVEQVITGATALKPLPQADFSVGDPRREPGAFLVASRSAYDRYGNAVLTMDGLGDPSQATLLPDADVNYVDDFLTTGGHVRQIQYDPVFHTYAIEEIIHVGMAHGERQEPLAAAAEYDAGFGVVTRSVDFNGNESLFHFDTFARLTAIQKPLDSREFPTNLFEYLIADPFRQSEYRYDRAGALTLVAAPSPIIASTVVTRAREQHGRTGTFDSYVYTDGLRRTVLSLLEDETTGTFNVKTASLFCLTQHPALTIQPYRTGSAKFHIPPIGKDYPAAGMFYDSGGREIQTVNPPETHKAGAPRYLTQMRNYPFETHAFDGEDNRAAGPHFNTPMEHRTDGLGRFVEAREMVAGETWVTRYRYDLNDNLVQTVDSQANQTLMRYDGLGRRILLNDPDRGYLFYTYDDASNVTLTKDAKNQEVAFTHDGVNRTLTEDYRDEGTSVSLNRSPDVAYHYDGPCPTGVDQGDRTTAAAANTKGALSWIADLSGEKHFSYDERGRLAWSVRRVPDPDPAINALVAYRSGFECDAMDRVTAQTYADNDRVTYVYNNRNASERVPGIITDIDYTPSGAPERIQYASGILTAYDYDPRLRLIRLRTGAQAGTGDSRLLDYEYTFDAASNITQATDRREHIPTADPRHNTQSFGYDDLYRLTRAQWADQKQIDYAYDRIGNMTRQSSPDSGPRHIADPDVNLGAMSYGQRLGASGRAGRNPNDPPGPHALTRTGSGRQYPYDANGNMTDMDGMQLNWDFKDRLRFLQKGNTRAEYIYDYADGRTVKKVTQDGRTSATLYVDTSFEVREAEAPAKYVLQGDKRTACIFGTIDPSRKRIQRLRLWPGQNLICLVVEDSTSFTARDIFGLGRPDGALAITRWNAAAREYENLRPSDPMRAAIPYWVEVTAGRVVPILGDYSPPQADIAVPTSNSLIAWPLLQPFVWRRDVAGSETSLLQLRTWDAATQQYEATILQPLLENRFPAQLPPGRCFWLTALATTTLRVSSVAQGPESILYYHQDHLGSPNIIADGQGRLIEENAFYPYGKLRNQREQPSHPGLVPPPYLFAQKEADAESGLLCFGARFFCPAIARFASADPVARETKRAGKETAEASRQLANPAYLNLYAYVNDSPVKYRDPDGRELRWHPNASEEFKKDIIQMIGYLEKAGAGEVLQKLHSRPEVVYIQEMSFDINAVGYMPAERESPANMGTILMHPRAALRTPTGEKMTPALVFLHEAGHALHHVEDSGGYDIRGAFKMDNWSNLEEKVNILDIEHKAARKLREAGHREAIRTGHVGQVYEAAGPTTTRAANEKISAPLERLSGRRRR